MKIQRFDQFINESYLKGGRSPLYHSTNIFNASEILNDNELRSADWYQHPGQKIISFSRNPNFIYMNEPVTLVFDSEKIRSKYKIKPFDFMAFEPYVKSNPKRKGDFEYEETADRDIVRLDKYLLEIRMNPSVERLRRTKLGTKEEYREAYDDFIKAVLEFKANNPSSPVKVFFKNKEVDDDWLEKQLSNELTEGVYNKMSGTRIYVTKAADQDSYRVYYSSYKPIVGDSKDEFMDFINKHKIEHTKAGKSTLTMNKANVEKLKKSMLTL
jgi:hypothetical protein